MPGEVSDEAFSRSASTISQVPSSTIEIGERFSLRRLSQVAQL